MWLEQVRREQWEVRPGLMGRLNGASAEGMEFIPVTFMEMYGSESLILFHKESVSVWRWI